LGSNLQNPLRILKRKLRKRKVRKKGFRANTLRLGRRDSVRNSSRKNGYLNILPVLGVIILIIGIVGWIAVSIFKLYSFEVNRAYRDERVIEKEWKGESRLNILFVGLDSREGEYAYVDAIILVMLDPDSKTVGIFNINPDTSVYVSEYDVEEKLRNLYNRGVIDQESIPILLLEDKVEKLFSINIDRYVLMREEGLVEMVDSLGAIYVNNEVKLIDLDAGQGGIDILPGSQRLEGNDYWGYVSADALGVEQKYIRQNEALESLLQRSVNYAVFFKIPRIVDTFSRTVRTDLSRPELLRLALTMNRANDVKSGFTKESAFEKVKLDEGIRLVPILEEIDQDIQKVFVDPRISKEQARVEVFNSTNIIGLGAFRARWLRNIGVDVIRVGDTAQSFEESVIYSKDPEAFKYTINGIKKSFDEEPEVVKGEPSDIISTGDVILIIGGNAEEN